MRVTEDIIKDSFYKMYFYLPDVGEYNLSYKYCVKDFWNMQGISGVGASIAYIRTETKEFLEEYREGVTDYSVNVKCLPPNIELDISDDQLNEAIFEYIQEKQTKLNQGHKCDRVNEYWKLHSQELLFLIRRRNNFENAAMKKEVQKNLSEFNDNALRFINELIQNADDCIYQDDFNAFTMLFDRETNKIKISYPEAGFTYADVISLSSINETNKMSNFVKATSTIGEKGRGFKSIFVYFKEVEILSGGFHFKYNVEEASMFQPLYIKGGEEQPGTQLTLKLRDRIILPLEEDEESVDSDIEKLIQDVECFYGAKNAKDLYRNNSIFFTRHFTELRIIFQGRQYSDLICIKNNHYITDADSQDTIWWHNPDGKNAHICKGDMSYWSVYQVKNDEVEDHFALEILDKAYQINLIGLINYLDYPVNIAENRFGRIRNTDVLNNLSKTMPVIMFGISGIDSQKESEIENVNNFTGHMYTYLPTSVNLNLPFIFQVPFDLENNRSCPKKGAWNNYLYDAIWGTNNSIVKTWYEYVVKHNLVENIYNYLPSKKYDKIAFYIDEKYNFDPMGGSRYAAVAKASIEKFNNSNWNRIRNLFANIKIFKCWNSNEVVSISKLKIVDQALAMFDIEEKNLLWDAYIDSNSELVRFERDISHEDSLKVVSFNRFLGNKDLTVKAREILDLADMHKYIKSNITALRKAKRLDYVHKFTSVYIQKRLWKKIFNIDSIEKLKEAEKVNIRAWGSKLLWFKLKTVEGGIRSFRYNRYKDNELDRMLWLYNISNEEIPSIKYEQGIYVCVLGKSDLDEETVKSILFTESQHVENLEEVYNSIDNWKNKDISLENKIDIIGIYYLLQKEYPEVITGTLHRVLSKAEDLSQIKFPPVLEKTMERQIEWERVKFHVWIACKKKKPYELDLDLLSEEIISLLNPIEGDFISSHDKNTKFKNAVKGYLLKDEDKENCTDAFKKKYLNIYVNPDYFNRIPGRNILKFPANHILILKELAALSEALESETKLSIDFIKEVRHIYEAIKNNTYTAPYGMKYELAVIKGIQAYQIYSLIDANNYREAIGNEGIVFNELLQNINDYIDAGTNVTVQLLENTDGKGIRIIYKEKFHQENRCGQTENRSGFQAKDILSLISIGVSSKKGKSDQYTGSKGIGFKNVYRMFDLIEVDSNRFQFALDDSFLVDAEKLFDDVSMQGIKSIQLDKKLKVENILENYREKTKDANVLKGRSERTKFPIIQVLKSPIDKQGYFRLNNNILGYNDLDEDSLTAFQFRFRKENGLYQSFIAQLRSNYYVDRILQNLDDRIQGHTFKKLSKQGYNYRILFLHNCKSICIESDEHVIERYEIPAIVDTTKNGLDESWVEDENFWSNRSYLQNLNLLPDKSPRYMRKKNTEEDGILKNVEVRFMKSPVILDDKGQKALNSNGILYVTLPLDFNVGGAVHINIPALETQANREKLVYCDANNYSLIGKWNRDIMEMVFGPQGVFGELFNSFSMKYKEIIANYAFMYIPLELYRIAQSRFPGIRLGINELKFIPCMTYQGIQMRSLQEVSRNTNIFSLRTYMYQWFDMMDQNFQKFYEKEDHSIEFIYMKNENDWDLINEFAQDKYEQIRPMNLFFDEEDFFDYISDYWELFYEGLDSDYQKECDKIFSNRINMITAKTGIDQHYTKWQVWKKLYRKQEDDKACYIEKMIRAVCFDINNFEDGFYFTEQDIRDCIGIEKLEIPSKIISRYKNCLCEKGYYDFSPYFSLVKKELQNEISDESFKYQLTIVNQYAIERYNPNQRNEIILSGMILSEEILEVVYDIGIKRLEDMREKLPVLLLNGKFCEEERDYFVELPSCLFEANKTMLKKEQDYDALLEFWDKKKVVVSRANIAHVYNLYKFHELYEEYEELLPYLNDSQMFCSLLEKNLSILYDHSSQVLSNILEFWYAKFTDFEKSFSSEYFFLYASLINVYLEKRGKYSFNVKACLKDVKFDIRYLLHEGNVDICNKINQEKFYLKIYIESSWYQNEPIQYWNEIEMNLTDEQRKRIAKQYVGECDQSTKIEVGIAAFLKHIYICDELPAIYSGYPTGKFLKIKIDDTSYDYDDGYLIFEDYTDAIIKLLKEEFDIIVKKSKYLPLGNLDEYNDLFPIGTQEEYEYIKREIVDILDGYMKRINECSISEEKQVKKEFDEYKLSLLALQYQMPGNLKVKGYGKECPLLMTNDVVELRSLQCFEHPIFGFHIGITLFGSKAARDVITKYATKLQVCVEDTAIKKKKSKKKEQKNSFSAEMGKYSFGEQSVAINSVEMQQNKEVVYQILSTLVFMLDNIQNRLILNIEMITDKGAKKKERFVLQLTHTHRALMVYEINYFMNKLLDE